MRDRWTQGVDEAGRGPVLGPLVVAAVAVADTDTAWLAEVGARDSKALSAERREDLAHTLRGGPIRWGLRVIGAPELDAGNLNTLCLQALVELHGEVPAATLQVDAPVHPAGLPNYRASVLQALAAAGQRVTLLQAENRAEDLFPAVGAASILAKVERDRLLREMVAPLESVHGPAGSGYPSDPRTRAFLRSLLRAGPLPPIVRSRWATVETLRREAGQGSLFPSG